MTQPDSIGHNPTVNLSDRQRVAIESLMAAGNQTDAAVAAGVAHGWGRGGKWWAVGRWLRCSSQGGDRYVKSMHLQNSGCMSGAQHDSEVYHTYHWG